MLCDMELKKRIGAGGGGGGNGKLNKRHELLAQIDFKSYLVA